MALDWGSKRLKIVETYSKDNTFHLQNFIVKKIEQYEDSKNQFEQRSESLRFLFKEKSVSTTKIQLILSGSDVIIKTLKLPLVQQEELKSLLFWEVQDIAGVSLENLVLDYEILSKTKDYYKVLLVIAYKKKLLKQIKSVEQLGLEVSKVKAAPLLLKNLVGSELKQKKLAIIDIGAQETELSIFKKGKFDFRRVLDLGGTDITTAIETENNLTTRKAEQVKRNNNCKIDLISSSLLKLIKKIGLSIHYWEQNGEKIELILLTGGGAKLKGLSQYLKQELGVAVKMLTGFSKFDCALNNCSFHFLKQQIPYLTIALAGTLNQNT